MKAVIMAGGKGTRISSIAADIPKPMIRIMGKPILEYQIECLKRQGFIDIVIVVGHLGSVIMDYFNDGSAFGVNIRYFCEKEPLGTAGALFQMRDVLTEDFIIINGDIIFDIDFCRMVNYHYHRGGLATIFTHPNDHPFDSTLITTGDLNKVTGWLHKEDERNFYKNRVNAGIHVLSPKVLDLYTDSGRKDMDRDVLKPLMTLGLLFAYDSPEYVKDMGTPKRYQIVTEDILSGKVQAKNLKNQQKAIFLDRDGTINEYCGFVTKPEQLKLIPGAAKAIELINKSGYLAIVISNQPVIARGDCTFDELDEINNKMETLLGQEGVYLDDIYYCPHHPDKGFAGERPELKIECSCRKPNPGLIKRAAELYNINLSESYMVGDNMSDVLTGKAAGCKTALLCNRETNDIPEDISVFSDLIGFVLDVLDNKGEETC